MNYRSIARSIDFWLVVAVPVLILVLGLAIDRFDLFPELREHVNSRAVPETLVRSGRTGRELRLLDYKPLAGISLEGFDSTLAPEELPSSTIVAEVARKSRLPTVSVVVDSDDLLNRETGLIANFDKRGRSWERPAYVSYFQAGDLVFGVGAGLRVHGGKSRDMTAKSFRLYFRQIYGSPSLSRDLIFGGARKPVKSLIIHNDIRTKYGKDVNKDWHFVNPIAYELAKRIGCITPATKPVQFYLNGVYQGPYVLTERTSAPNFLISRLGHDDFFLADTKSDDGTSTLKQGSDTELRELNDWSRSAPAPLSMAEVAERVNLRNLTDWFISILYAGTTDPFQGMIARDRAGKDTRWFWTTWDMDHSFMDLYKQASVPWEIDTFTGRGAAIAKQDRDVRAVIFNRLRLESPEYRRYFLSRLVRVLNHELTPEFFDELIGRYERTAKDFGIQDRSYFETLRGFVANRPTVLRSQMNTYFNSGPSNRLTVEGSASLGIMVDGENIGKRYTGWYFADTPARIEVGNSASDTREIWLINGEVYHPAEPYKEIQLSEDTVVKIRADN